jgi:sugar phosphate isomerase/epimerase
MVNKMYNFKIGALLESFKLPTVDALKLMEKMKIDGFQMYATSGKHAPENMSTTARRELLDQVKSHGLVFSAICGDLGMGFGDPMKNPELIEKSKRIVELALDLESNIITTHIGVVPTDKGHERYRIMQDACSELALFAHGLGAFFAIETGPETAVVLCNFLDSLDSRGMAVNLDPANLVMVTGDDPVQAVHTLKNYIVHTHAKDGRKLMDGNPEAIYGIIEDVIQAGEFFEELPLGKGDVDFDGYLKALHDIGFDGFLTIEREVGDDPAGDIEDAVKFLRAKM